MAGWGCLRHATPGVPVEVRPGILVHLSAQQPLGGDEVMRGRAGIGLKGVAIGHVYPGRILEPFL